MSGPRFVPLACPGCGADLSGRACDVVACCAPCGIALRCGSTGLTSLEARTIAVDDPRAAGIVPLPFWASDSAAAPAFLSARPLALTRLVSGLLRRWRTHRGVRTSAPLGARLAPETLVETARMAGLDPPGDTSLLVVPCRPVGRGRWALPGAEEPLWPDDVLETRALIEAAAGATKQDRTLTRQP